MRKLCIVILILILVILVLPINFGEYFSNSTMTDKEIQEMKRQELDALKSMIIDFVKRRMNRIDNTLVNKIIDTYQTSQGLCMKNNAWDKCDPKVLEQVGLTNERSSKMNFFDRNVKVTLFGEKNDTNMMNLNKTSNDQIGETLMQLYTQLKLNDSKLESDVGSLTRQQVVKLGLIYNNMYYSNIVPSVETDNTLNEIKALNQQLVDIMNKFERIKQIENKNYQFIDHDYMRFIRNVFNKYYIKSEKDKEDQNLEHEIRVDTI